jgi:hypothetical protein
MGGIVNWEGPGGDAGGPLAIYVVGIGLGHGVNILAIWISICWF